MPCRFFLCSSAAKVALLVILLDLIGGTTAATSVSTAVLGLAWKSPIETQYRCAFDIAVNQINADSSLLPDTQLLSREIHTDCTEITAVNSAMDAAENNLASQKCAGSYVTGANGPAVAIIGAYCSSSSKGISSVMNKRHIPIVSFGSTAVTLSNKFGALLSQICSCTDG